MSGDRVFFCAGSNEMISGAHPIGVGLVESASRLTSFLEKQKPEKIVFLGSCGSYGEKKIFDILYANRAANVEFSLLSGDAFCPIENTVSATSNVPRGTFINSSNYITASKEAAKKFLDKELDAENMEFFAFLYVAGLFNVEASGIFVVTNYCYENAHQEYRVNYKKALEILENEKQKTDALHL